MSSIGVKLPLMAKRHLGAVCANNRLSRFANVPAKTRPLTLLFYSFTAMAKLVPYQRALNAEGQDLVLVRIQVLLGIVLP